ncbi:MAG: CDP-alcohol phosphatidyltransferase family protein [Anaerolineales bacterium]|nr:CDP-alcohol phosphatidyltransferase family protein [Anaerolineales bacterium]
MTKPGEQKRVNNMLLGPLERPALRWLSAHMPAGVTPNVLTYLGLAGAIVTFVAYGLSRQDHNYLWVASLGFIMNWLGDSLDGTLARYRKIERPRFGFYVDHSADAFTQVLFFAGLGISPYVRFDLALLALIGYLLISILTYINAIVGGEFRISYAKIGPTEMRVIAILTNLYFYFGRPTIWNSPIGSLSNFDAVLLVIAVVLFGGFLVTAIMKAREWDKLDPGKKTGSSPGEA